MFFAYIMSILIIIGFLYLIWIKVVKPLLEGHGIQIDEEEEIETDHTKRLDKTKEEHQKKILSAQAVKEEMELRKDIDYFDKEIERAEEEMKK